MHAQDARQVGCPACNTRFMVPTDELEVVCPACMNAFTVHARAGAPQEGLPASMEFEVKGPNGETMGQLDRHRIREAIYAGRLKGREELRGPKGWEPIAERPEFAEVFQLVGIDLGALRISQQQIRGWRKSTPEAQPRRGQAGATKAPKAGAPKAGATPGPAPLPGMTAPEGFEVPPLPPEEKPPVPLKALAIGVGVVLALALGGAVVFALL